jgi:hypothetical protein
MATNKLQCKDSGYKNGKLIDDVFYDKDKRVVHVIKELLRKHILKRNRDISLFEPYLEEVVRQYQNRVIDGKENGTTYKKIIDFGKNKGAFIYCVVTHGCKADIIKGGNRDQNCAITMYRDIIDFKLIANGM